ncbi:MAG: GNAT family N-acetyltransferase [Chloroflexi bacterium]|nr:GNAT family N-acetyltransferase [Chloroflexota bacterium]
MQLKVHTTRAAFDELRQEWDSLLERSYANIIFLTWEWQSTWWDSYEAGDLWLITCRSDSGELLGIAPWFIEPHEGERVVRVVGCIDVTDYVDVIAEPGHAEEVLEALAGFLMENRSAYTRINFCNLQEASPALAILPEKMRIVGFNVDVVLQEVCPVIQLPSTWEGYLEALDKKQRHEIRRKIRRAEGESVSHYIVGPDADLTLETQKFLHLMRASHPEKAVFLDDPKNDRFFRAIIERMHERGWLKMSFLLVNGNPCAAYCNFDYGGHVLVYNSGMEPEASAPLSAGIVLLSYDIRHAIESGRSVFDFLRGNETYKYRMGGVDTRVFMLKAS